MQLLGISKASLYRFLAPLIQAFATGCKPVLIDTLDAVLPDMPGDHFGGVATGGAGAQQRALATLRGVGVILPIALAGSRAIANDLIVGTTIAIAVGMIDKLSFISIAVFMGRPAIADDTVDIALLQAQTNGRSLVTGIEPHRAGDKSKGVTLTIQACQIRP